ncbi:MAG: hypothetical protein M3Z02_04530 [Actinomycetota bacterium]|nr:hypothetical protein [Actinomycetota bacterium]
MPVLRLLPDLEEALRQIHGVRAATVVTGPDRRPTEVHVLATTDRGPKQVVRDVQSLAMARYDLDIDYRIVSVVQIDPDEAPLAGTPGSAPASRPVIDSITVRTTGTQATATVIVMTGSDRFEGTSAGPAAPSGRPRLVAKATLEAVRGLLQVPAELEQAAIVAVGGVLVAVSVVQVNGRSGEQTMSGSAVTRGDEADAVARSLLDALNRRLSS